MPPRAAKLPLCGTLPQGYEKKNLRRSSSLTVMWLVTKSFGHTKKIWHRFLFALLDLLHATSNILRLLRKTPTLIRTSLWTCPLRLCGNVLLPTQSEHSTDDPKVVYS